MFANAMIDRLTQPVREAKPSRRTFLKITGGAGAGLVIGMALPRFGASSAAAAEEFEPNPFVRVAPDNTVTVIIKHLDMGQGVETGLSTLVAEELDATWQQIRADFAPADASRYNNLFFGQVQGTGGSTSIANSFQQYRKAGAIARAMLATAAAKEWGVPESEITVSQGRVRHGSGKSATFGALAEKAALLPVPQDAPLKDPKDFVYIGKTFPRLDTASKTNGTALYALDVKQVGMLIAVVARPPRFGGKVKSFDAAEAKAVRGVVDVVRVPQGVAVLATSTWPAIKGRDALTVEWDDSAAEKRSTDALLAEYKALARTQGLPARKDGDAEAAIAAAGKVLEAEFEFPYLAHAPMEPLDVTVLHEGDRATFWTGSQLQTVDQNTAAAVLGLKPEQVAINTLYAGGSFGRRAIYNSHYVAEAAEIAKAYGKPVPIKVVWTREDDIRGGYYRPMYVHKLKAGLDGDGNLVGWHQRIVGQSILSGTLFDGMVKDGIDETSVEGASDLPYHVDNITVELHTTKVGVPILWWRSVGHTHTGYATEVFIDEIAHAAGRDPVDFRLSLLKDHPRHAGVLKLAAEKAGWGKAPPAGRSRGVAVHKSFNSFVAQVAEVSLRQGGGFKVERVVCAIDCGVAVNPDQVRAQMEGGIGFGLGHILRDAITLTDGRVDQSNFHDYEPLRITDMPVVEVHIVPSAEAPTGVGEPGVPPVGPAVANALFAATGKRIRKLPFAGQDLS